MKNKGLCLSLIVALLFLSACSKVEEKMDEASLSDALSSPSAEIDIAGESSEMLSTENDTGREELLFYDNACEAYYAKCQELIEEYGSGKLVERTADHKLYKEESCCYMSGLCFVDLIDLNGGENKELLVVYCHEEDMGTNIDGMEIPRARNYCVEIWTYEEGQLKLIISVDHASSYLKWRDSYLSWDTDNCFLTVYEIDGQAVLQIYEESSEGDIFTNYSADGDELECEVYTSKDGKFYIDGEEGSEGYWYFRVCGYDTILASVQLSCSDYGREWAAYHGVDMSYGLEQSAKNIEGLSNQTPQAMLRVSGSYFSAYMETLWKIRQDVESFPISFRMPSFTLYDMDGNGIPELIVDIAPNEAGAHCQVYTYASEETVLCGEGASGHCTFYTGTEGGLVRTEGHMDTYHYEKWDLQGTELVITEFASGTTEPTEGYPPLENYGYQAYDHDVWFWDGDLSTLLYMSGLEALESVQRFEETVSATADTDYKYVYEDLNHDGAKELLAVLGGYEVWYCDSDGSPCEMVHKIEDRLEKYKIELLRLENETHVAIDAYNMIGNYRFYSILALKEGRPKCLVEGGIGYVYENRFGDIVLDIQEYDGHYDADLGIHTTHTWKDTFLYYDGETYKEYAAAILTEKEFLSSYANASDVLDRIRQGTKLAEGESLEITAFFVRGNGIVQIQCEHRFSYGSIDFFYYELRSDENNMLSGGEELNYGKMYQQMSGLEAVYPTQIP
ncbi:MAG: hypothetical protein NC092_09355 [Butyrivibrio sp.]|nr:hypothetical protein [Muribaculum sp.]MCM1552882.1 hypothetical protein [Butyrivibrio sp.]